MESISDILNGLARQRGRGESPLVLLRPIAGTPGERVSHVPISQQLSQAWVRLTGEPFRPHQALALATLRRGEPVALRGAGPSAIATAQLLLFELLRAEERASALLLLPDAAAAAAQRELLAPLNQALPRPIPIELVDGSGRPSGGRLLLASPEALHARLLRFHERAWRPFWGGLRALAIVDAHTYHGVAGAHLAALLLRCARLRPPGVEQLQLLATLAPAAGAEQALAALWGRPWRVVQADDGPLPPTQLAVWRAGAERLREAAALALACQRAGLRTHLTCAALELAALRQQLGDDAGLPSLGTAPQPADVQLLVGYPNDHAALRYALRSGAQATVLVLGELPYEQTLARLPHTLISDPDPAWAPAPANAYATQQHLLCAAGELPLSEREVEAWQASEIVARLERSAQLVRLPGDEPAWQPRAAPAGEAAPDPYADFALLAAGSPPVRLFDERRQSLGQLDPAAFDRWGFPGAALPPLRSRQRVFARDEERATLTLRADGTGRRTFPLRRAQASVRDQRGSRTLRGGRTITWGRVTVEEEIYAFREAQPGTAPAERQLAQPLSTRWPAYAAWLEIGEGATATGQLVGWSLVAALPLRALAAFTDVVPVYDGGMRRLYLVDAQPGGNGLAAWLYEHLEELLPLAHDIALDCRADALLEPLARADRDWLLLLLGGDTQRALQEALLNEPVASPPAPPERRAVPLEQRPAPPLAETRRPAEQLPLASPREPTSEPPQRVVPPPPPAAAETPRQAQNEVAPPQRPPVPQPPAAESRRGGQRSPERRRRANGAARRPADEPQQSAARPPDPLATKRVPPADIDDLLPPIEETHAPEPPPPALEEQPDTSAANAMIARMRRLREQRERANPAPPTPRQAAEADVQTRFQPNDLVACLPYGEGTVRESRIEKGQEVLLIEFPDHGELTIDPSVSLVRLVQRVVDDEA